MKPRWAAALLLCAFIFTPASGGARAADGGLFPAEPIPGQPGADGKERPVWAYPERLPYAGSVEHYRHGRLSFMPNVLLRDADTLVKNFKAWELPGVAAGRVETWAEPVYYIPKYGLPKPTGEKRPPVKVARWRTDDPPFRLALGRLKPSYYIVRVVAAIATEDLRPSPKPVVMRFRVNDGPDGALSVATRRHRTIDNFYSIAEYYFRAYDDRDFTVELELAEGTEVDLLVHNIDVHDVFGHLAGDQAKRAPTLFTGEERARQRADFPDKTDAEAFRRVHGARMPVRPYRNKPLTPEQRARLDEKLWNGLPAMNSQFNSTRGKMNRATKEEIAAAKERGVEDPGWGVYFPETRNYWTPVADQWTQARRSYQYEITPMDGEYPASEMVLRYHFTGDTEAARDAAFRLCRIAYLLPTWDSRNSIQFAVHRPDQTHNGSDISLYRRYYPGNADFPIVNPVKLAHVYDILFDFISGNEELARAVGRFVPGIRTSDDVLRMLDTNLLQFPAERLLCYHMGNDMGTPGMMVTLATVQGDAEVTRPWMEWLFTRTWMYPLVPSGIQDYLNTTTTRDGTTYIGSWFYSAGGGRGKDIAMMLERYHRAGGDPRYTLVDFRLYPKLLTSCEWLLEGRVAGLWPMQIGDVGGPTIPYGHWFGGEKDIRTGWRWSRDARFAWCLKHVFGRGAETDAEWRDIEEAAAGQRNPWFANRSRVLSQWAGILESGTEHEDFRFRRAVTVRVGNGLGHAHNDSLDLNLFAHGCVMAPDAAMRPGSGRPQTHATQVHNVVEVGYDSTSGKPANWFGHGWISTLADAPGAASLVAEGTPPAGHRDVNLFQRHVALIDVDEGRPSATPITPALQTAGATLPADIITPHSYVFDVFRVSGGRRHTYSFHGGQNDGFEHNLGEVTPLAQASAAEQAYLRDFRFGPDRRWVADSREHLQAAWRLSREPVSLKYGDQEYAMDVQEPANLGPNYDPASPRKFTRLHVLGQPDARVLRATWARTDKKSRVPKKNFFDCLFVQKTAAAAAEDPDLESAFVALIEPAAGEAAIQDCALLDIVDNETDARRAVAARVEVAPSPAVGRAARTDVLFSDGRPDKVRTVGDMRLSGRFALVSTDAEGLRQATLVGGAALETPNVGIALSRREYTAKIVGVDYLERTLTLDTALPADILDGAFCEVGNDTHRTSIEIVRVKGKTLRFRKGVEIVTTRVIEVDEATGIITARLGMPPAGSPIRGMDAGLTATNEDRSKSFRCEYLGPVGDARSLGYRYRLTGAKVTARDFPQMSALRVFEVGPGDALRLTAFMSLRRVGDGVYQLTANAPAAVRLGGGRVLFSTDRKAWTELPAGNEGEPAPRVSADLLHQGAVYIRAE